MSERVRRILSVGLMCFMRCVVPDEISRPSARHTSLTTNQGSPSIMVTGVSLFVGWKVKMGRNGSLERGQSTLR